MQKNYNFQIEGSSANSQTWITSGKVYCEFADAFNRAMSETFEQLTNGKAIFGNPGIGCRGPYDIHRVIIEQEKQ
jgi:hypothetical protein